jgi:putative hydrolase of the HAD superfamily
MTLSTIAFDADDTLWDNEKIFKLTEQRFRDLLTPHCNGENLYDHLLETERKNLSYYGYGIKGFTLSMVETAISISKGKIPASDIQEILNAGRQMHEHPATPYKGAKEVLEILSKDYRIVLITKGDLFDQERKLAQSGLGDFFDAVEIVSEKQAQTYRNIFEKFGDGAARSMMIGNSLKSDVTPALEAGAYGIYIPSEVNWALEAAEKPATYPRFHELASLREVPGLIRQLVSEAP